MVLRGSAGSAVTIGCGGEDGEPTGVGVGRGIKKESAAVPTAGAQTGADSPTILSPEAASAKRSSDENS